jgi:tRNA-uridine aminocarboxypropyltransferase
MRRRAKQCSDCLMPLAFCVCQVAKSETVATRVTVVIHFSDVTRTTNTGKWIPLVLTNSEVLVRGQQEAPLDITRALQPGYQDVLLFPSSDSVPLTPDFLESLAAPVNLIVPDGNWNQAGKMVRREKQLDHLPRVHLPIDKPSRYRLRTAARDHWISTFEAIARSLGVLESPGLQKRLEHFFDVAVERILFLKGEVAREEVTGGISQEMIRRYHTDNGDQDFINSLKNSD